jgi:hypothetical protein
MYATISMFFVFKMRRRPSEVVDWRIQWQKRDSNDLQNTGQKTKDRATRSPLKASAPEGLEVSTSLMTLVVLLLNQLCHGGLVYYVWNHFQQ